MRWGLLWVCLLAGCPTPSRPVPLEPGDAGEDAGVAPCRLSTFPESLDFGEINAFTTAFTTLRVTNLGTHEITVVSALDPPFSLPFGEKTLGPGESVTSNVEFRPVDSLLHFSEIELRSLFDPKTGISCVTRVPVRGLGRGVFTVTPNFLDFGPFDPGQPRTLEVELNNTRRVPIVIDQLTIDEDVDAGVPVFTLEGPSRIEVPPVSVRTLRITATPPGFDVYGATLSGFGPLARVDVRLQVVGGAPVAQFAPESIDVPVVEFSQRAVPPSFVERLVKVRNVGDDAGARTSEGGLRLVSPLFTVEREDGGLSQNEVQVQLPAELFNALPPGKEASFIVRLIPGSLGLHRFRVAFFTNDPRKPLHELLVSCVATSLPACSLQRPSEVVFTAAGDAGSTGQVSFINTGTTPCVLDDVRLQLFSDPDFTVTSGELIQRTLAPGERHEVSLHGPDAGSQQTSALVFHVLGEGSRQESVGLSSPP